MNTEGKLKNQDLRKDPKVETLEEHLVRLWRLLYWITLKIGFF